VYGINIFLLICHIRFINIEPSAVDDERDTMNASGEENLTLSENVIGSPTISGEMQNPDPSMANTTISPSLSTKLWNGLNAPKRAVRMLIDIKLMIIR